MLLIADSGSTKTDWKCTDGAGKVYQVRTNGINPYYLDRNAIGEEISACKKQLSHLPINRVYFYGAGCSTAEQKYKIEEKLAIYFNSAKIRVENDLLGAARALCQNDPGIACILGTGSGSCVYNGVEIIKSVPSLGFILGDEGSGAYLGKQLIRDFLREEMPPALIQLIKSELSLNKEEVLENVNRKPLPSRYLAQFSKFIFEQIQDPYIRNIIRNSFFDFIDKYVVRYNESQHYKIHFVGSIAINYRSILAECLLERNLEIGKVENSPINGLVEFHLSNY